MDDITEEIQEMKEQISMLEKGELGEKIWFCKNCYIRLREEFSSEKEKKCSNCYKTNNLVVESQMWKNLKIKDNTKLTNYDKTLLSKLLRNESLDNPENVFKIISFLRKFIQGEEIYLLIESFRKTIIHWKSSKQNYLDATKINDNSKEFFKFHSNLLVEFTKAEQWCFDLSMQYFIQCNFILEKLNFDLENDDLAFDNFEEENGTDKAVN